MLTLMLVLAALQPADEAVRRLRSDDLAERDGAAAELRRLGEAARPALERAARDTDADAAGRASRVLRAIDVERRVSPAVRAALPGLVDRLIDEDAWVEAFVAACEYAETGPPSLTQADLAPLAEEAIRRMRDNDAWEVLRHAHRWRLAAAVRQRLRAGDRTARQELLQLRVMEAVPDLVRHIAEGDPIAAETLRPLRSLAHAPDLRKLLKHPDAAVRAAACDVLGAWRDADSRREFLRLLDDPISAVRVEAVYAVGKVGTPHDFDAVAARLDDEDGHVRLYAVRALPTLDPARAPERLERRLDDPTEGVRRAAIDELAALDARACAPAIRKRLADRSSDVRSSAIRAVATLGDREAIRALVEHVRGIEHADEALAALRELHAREVAPALLEMLNSDSVASALGALGGDAEAAAVEPLLVHPREEMRGRALVVLAGIRKSEALAAVERALDDASAPVSRTALRLQRELAPERADAFALKAVADTRSPLRSHALDWVERRRLRGATEALGAWLRDEGAPWRSIAIADALAAVGAGESAPLVVEKLGAMEGVQRAWMARPACLLGAREGAHVLIAASWTTGGG